MRWDADTIEGKFSFIQGIGSGDVKGDFNINFKSKDYRSAISIQKLDLNIIEQYLKNLSNYVSFSANLDADIKANGNFNNQEDITVQGMLAINEFHFGKSPKEDFASFDKLVLAIEKLSPKNHQYLLDSVSLNRPYFKYDKYDYLDNLQTMFGAKGSNIKAAKANTAQFNLIIEIGDYIKVLSKNFFKSDYKINRLAVYNGDVKFNDYSINEKYSIGLNPLNFISDSIDKNHRRVEASFKSAIKPYGDVSITLSINPKDSSDFDLQYHLKRLSAAMFNPYIISYTSFPLDRGTIELDGNWHVKNGNIESKNHLLVIDPRATKRIKNKGTKWIPLWLVMAFVRERGNVIDYEVPITGNLKNPKFHLHDIVVDLLTNIFVKPVTTPYIIKVKTIEAEIEKSLTLKWTLAHYSLRDNQKKFIEKMANFLVENPQAAISIYPKLYTIKEKEYILFFEAKKKYFLLINHKNEASFNKYDLEKVEKMSVKDLLFVEYLNKHIKGTLLFTIQDKCTKFIGSALVNTKLKELNKERLNTFILYFNDKGLEGRVKINPMENIIPYNGFSFYKIDYKGELPKTLIKAYQKMNELNDKEPREKFEKQREKNKNTF
jgi:hypothetical protein